MKEIWRIFLIFCRIGGFTFGGGYAMLPIIQKEIAEERKWASEEEIIDYYAIGQCTPGIIAINTATMIGYRQKGVLGALAATAGMVFPSLLIITIIAAFFQRFQEYQLVQNAFEGIQIAVIALILDIVLKMWKRSVKDYFGILVFVLGFLMLAFFRLSPVVVILSSALGGIIVQIKRNKGLGSSLDKSEGDLR
ncbi:chromate transporter [Iocasia frigidifontis]|uniref:Chromate transporter n=1 Tax=Iocasia fonsfrigidae TaxID=2682810 RepID=A0A8A7KJB8_9FIRM|nr:chromate transporter [Iocasia fonsfrigidae]QTL99679.1 chromate transporter [Iocasia fonsfrigidae]